MSRLRLCIWLVGSVLILWPVWGWAASPLQDGGTIPAPVPTEPPLPLTFRAIFTIPDAVMINEAFELITNIQNTTSIAMDSLVVTYRDVADDQALIALNGSKTDVVRAPGPLQGIEIAKGLRYLLFFPSRREIEVRLDYTYTVDGQTIARTQTGNVVFLVAVPTPTPTITWTPTPTPVPTSTPSPTATLSPTIAPPSPTPIIIVVTPAAPEPVAPGGNESSFGPSSPSEEFHEEADGSFGGVGGGRPAVVVEFEDVPLMVRPGGIFTMTLVVRNISTATVTAVVATWDTTANPAIAPIGAGTSWYLNDIRPGDKQSVSGRFYVDDGASAGIQTVWVTVEYREAGQSAKGKVNLLVRDHPPAATPTPAAAGPPAPAEEPLWLRIIRALFGGP